MNIEVVVVDYHDAKQAQELSMLLNGYAQDPMGGGEPLSPYVMENLASELAKVPHAFSLICYVDGKPAGLTNCIEGYSTFKCKPLVNIHDIGVLPEFRGLKLSKRMMEKVEEIAREKGACKLTLEVLEGNTLAKNAYEKFGFAAYELDPKMGKAEFMEKPLS